MKKSLVLSAAVLAAASFSFTPQLRAEDAADQAATAQQQAQRAARQAGQDAQQAGQDARQTADRATGRQSGAQEDPKQEQENFVKDSASDNQFEIQAGKFVEQHAQNPQVKEFAQKLQQDHQQAQEQLKQAAQGAGVTISDQLMPVQQAKLEELQKKQGESLERAFVFDQIGDHQKDILCNEYAAQHAQNQQIKQFAQQQVPALREHLHMAMQTAEQWVPQAREAGERMQGHRTRGQAGSSGINSSGTSGETGASGTSSGRERGESSGTSGGQTGGTSSGTSGGQTGGTSSGTSGGTVTR
jgi:putative membrane protein